MKYKNLALIISSIFITLFFIEIFLYIDNKNFYEPKYIFKTFSGKNFKINSTIYDEDRDDKIILFGDSFMLGSKCGSSKNLPGMIAENLKYKYQVVNFGQPATNSIDQYLNINRYLKEEIKPKMLILGLYSNDIHMNKSYCDFIDDLINYKFFNLDNIKALKEFCKNNKNISRIQTFDWHKFGITQLLNEAIIKIFYFFKIDGFNTRLQFYNDLNDTNSLEYKLFIYSLIKINEILEANNIKNYMFFFPNAEDLNIDNDISDSYKDIKKYLRVNFNIEIANGYSFFNKQKKISMTASTLDKHPNCKYYKTIYDYMNYNNIIIN